MSLIGKNIRKIRTIKGLSQVAFANIFGLTRASIGAYEEGRAEPKVDMSMDMAKYFGIPIETFLSHELTVNEFANFNLQKFIGRESITETKSIPLISGWNWGQFIQEGATSEFPAITFPLGVMQGDMAIEIHEKITSPYHTGTILFCKEEEAPSENNIYLVIDGDTGAVKNAETVELSDGSKLYRILQTIGEPTPVPMSDLEGRVRALELSIKKLQSKAKRP